MSSGGERCNSSSEVFLHAEQITNPRNYVRVRVSIGSMILNHPSTRNPLRFLYAPRPQSPGTKSRLPRLSVTICEICYLAAPYVVIQLLTGFDAGQSTRSQRAWLMAWLVIGQVYGIAFFNDRNRYLLMMSTTFRRMWPSIGALNPIMSTILALMLVGLAAMGGFVVVGQMILQDEICAVI